MELKNITGDEALLALILAAIGWAIALGFMRRASPTLTAIAVLVIMLLIAAATPP